MRPLSQQDGFSLLVVMVFLLVLGLLGFAVTKSAIVQEKISGNLREKSIAFLAAESALRSGEAYLATADDASLTQIKNASSTGISMNLGGTSTTISLLSASGGITYYRIVASGTGVRNDSVTALEAVVSVEE